MMYHYQKYSSTLKQKADMNEMNDDDVYLDKLQTRGVKKSILDM
jgi:hypothetical protein